MYGAPLDYSIDELPQNCYITAYKTITVYKLIE